MNKDQVEGSWKIFKGKVKERWGELTDDELDQLEGKKDQLAGFIQKRTGESKEQVQKELDRWAAEI